jgi:hypothetical protein
VAANCGLSCDKTHDASHPSNTFAGRSAADIRRFMKGNADEQVQEAIRMSEPLAQV